MLSAVPIEQHLERATQAVAKRLLQLYEGLEQLAALTVLSLQGSAASEEVAAWIEADFAIDPDGYFERPDLLAAARAGEIDPEHFVYYVDQRFSEAPAVHARLFQLRHLGPRLRRVRQRLAGIEWIYYQDAAGWALSYPQHDPSPTIPADFDWLSYFTFQAAEPGANPEREIRWTPPNIDYGGKGLMVSPSIPVYLDDGTFAGVWSMDVPVKELLAGVELHLDLPGQEIFIVDAKGMLIAHRRIAAVIDAGKGSYSRESMASLGEGFARLDLERLLAEERGRWDVVGPEGEALVCLHRSIPELGWLVIASFPAEGILARLRESFREAFQRLGQGDLSFRIEADLGGELQALVEGYNRMAATLEETLAERGREQQALQASQRIQAIGQLAGGVAHDFNNLLTVIMSSTALLNASGADESLLSTIQTASERAAALTHQLLAFSRRDVATPRPLDLGRVLAEGRSLLRRLLPEGISLAFHVPDRLPPVLADPTQLLQLILNLVVNARDAVGTSGRIEVGVRLLEGERVCVSVTDDGRGMSPEVQERAFEAFFTTKSTGTGLGLATVRQIVDGLGGRVEIESELGVGTTVRLRLPCASEPVAAPAVVSTTSPGLEGQRILVLDDDPLVRETTVRSLAVYGAQVVGCRTLKAMLARLEAAEWDLLVTDVVMPEGGGREAARRAREVRPELKVLFVSGYTDDALLVHGFQVAEEQLLRKPFTPSGLAEAARTRLGLAAARGGLDSAAGE